MDEGWYFDSAATSHMTHQRLTLQNFTQNQTAKSVMVGNKGRIAIEAKGEVSAQSCQLVQLQKKGSICVLRMFCLSQGLPKVSYQLVQLQKKGQMCYFINMAVT